MAGRVAWTPEQDEVVKGSWADPKMSIETIGDLLELKPHTVKYRAEILGLGPKARMPLRFEPKHQAPQNIRAVVESLRAKGLGSHEIARQAKCAHSYVWRIININTHADIRAERVDDSEHVERILAQRPRGFPVAFLPARQRVRA
jgi:hypothetical protein